MATNKCQSVKKYVGHTKYNQTASFGMNMVPRIKSVESVRDYPLLVVFDDGRRVLFDVGDDINNLAEFKNLKTVLGLWQQVRLDSSRTCVYWNDRIDIASDTIYEYGRQI